MFCSYLLLHFSCFQHFLNLICNFCHASLFLLHQMLNKAVVVLLQKSINNMTQRSCLPVSLRVHEPLNKVLCPPGLQVFAVVVGERPLRMPLYAREVLSPRHKTLRRLCAAQPEEKPVWNSWSWTRFQLKTPQTHIKWKRRATKLIKHQAYE